MQTDLEEKDNIKLNNSKLGVIAFIIFLSPLIPFVLLITLNYLGIFENIHQVLFFSHILFEWLCLAIILAFTFSIADLTAPKNRKKTLSKIVFMITGLIIIYVVITWIHEIIRIMS